MGCYSYRLMFYFYQPCVILHDGPCKPDNCSAVPCYEYGHYRYDDVDVCPGLWYVLGFIRFHVATGRVNKFPLAIGPLLLGPLSEIYGRSRVLQLSNLWYAGQ